jgi:hypothetical protein
MSREDAMLRRILAYAGLALAAAAGPAHAQQPQQAPTPQPIRIGATTSITGAAYSLQGGYVREGYLLCQREAPPRACTSG